MRRRKRLKRLERPQRYRFKVDKKKQPRRKKRRVRVKHPVGTLLIWQVSEFKED